MIDIHVPITVELDPDVPDDEIQIDWVPAAGEPVHIATMKNARELLLGPQALEDK